MKRLFFLFLLFSNVSLIAQKLYDATWVIGGWPNNMLLHIDTSTILTNQVNSNILFFATNSSISDSTGNLLFFTDGINVYDSTFSVMTNGDTLSPSSYTFQYFNQGLGIFQGALILPVPDSPHLFYIFHETIDSLSSLFGQPYYLYYSIVDMSLNNGLGSVVSKNNIFFQDTLILGRLTSCKHANGRDWWLISHEIKTNLYYKWLITPNGISVPYLQNIGKNYLINTGYGYSCFSPDGSQFCTVYTDNIYFKTIELFKFDRCAGLFFDSLHLELPVLLDFGYYSIGCAFSPNSRYLYVCVTQYIYQFDTWAVDIPASKKLVATFDGYIASDSASVSVFALLELAPNGKIIVGSTSSSILLSTIDQPNNGDTLCNVLQHNITLPAYNFYTLPNFPDYRLGSLPGSPCDTLTGVADLGGEKEELKVFPNPAHTMFKVSGLRFKIEEITVLDVMGKIIMQKEVKKENETEVDVSSFDPGLYFIHIKTQRGVYTQKIIKE